MVPGHFLYDDVGKELLPSIIAYLVILDGLQQYPSIQTILPWLRGRISLIQQKINDEPTLLNSFKRGKKVDSDPVINSEPEVEMNQSLQTYRLSNELEYNNE